MQTLSQIRAMLNERGLAPQKRFGQNFLHDANQIRRLVDASGVGPGDVVLEVGPGTGALTVALLDAGAEVIACEIDRGLGDLIEETLADRVTLVRGDCLEKGRRVSPAVFAAIGDRPFTLVANLPYQAASPLMSSLLIDAPACRGQHVTIQSEVADRLVAGPGSKTYGPLGIIVQSLATVRRIATIPASCFWPAPKVTSAAVSITPRADHGIDDQWAFARFVVELFMARRKQLGTTLGRDTAWPDGITADLRPDAVGVDAMVDLWRVCRASGGDPGEAPGA